MASAAARDGSWDRPRAGPLDDQAGRSPAEPRSGSRETRPVRATRSLAAFALDGLVGLDDAREASRPTVGSAPITAIRQRHTVSRETPRARASTFARARGVSHHVADQFKHEIRPVHSCEGRPGPPRPFAPARLASPAARAGAGRAPPDDLLGSPVRARSDRTVDLDDGLGATPRAASTSTMRPCDSRETASIRQAEAKAAGAGHARSPAGGWTGDVGVLRGRRHANSAKLLLRGENHR
jgi:hypothetical protein